MGRASLKFCTFKASMKNLSTLVFWAAASTCLSAQAVVPTAATALPGPPVSHAAQPAMPAADGRCVFTSMAASTVNFGQSLPGKLTEVGDSAALRIMGRRTVNVSGSCPAGVRLRFRLSYPRPVGEGFQAGDKGLIKITAVQAVVNSGAGSFSSPAQGGGGLASLRLNNANAQAFELAGTTPGATSHFSFQLNLEMQVPTQSPASLSRLDSSGRLEFIQ